MKIVLTGGGTAGHVMPNMALLPLLNKHFDKIEYIGTNGIEKTIVKKHKEILFHEISAVKFVRAFKLSNLLIPFKLLRSIRKCKRLLKNIQPDIVFSKGGYVSIPVVIACKKLKIPVVSHESDLTMGLANRIIKHFCNIVCTSFKQTANAKKCVWTGSPIREEIFLGKAFKVEKEGVFNSNLSNILFFGGSLGAKAINSCVFSNLNRLCAHFNIVHIVGKNNFVPEIIPNYVEHEFVDNIEDYFAWADVVVCRGGANALFELLAIKKPMLIIPLPKAQSRGDQIENAKNFLANGYSKVLWQEQLNYENLVFGLNQTLANSKKLIGNMNKRNLLNSNAEIVNILIKLARK